MKTFIAVLGFTLGWIGVLLQLGRLPELSLVLANMNSPETTGGAIGFAAAWWVTGLCAAGVAIKCGMFLASRGKF